MANVKITSLPELSADQIGKFTWFLAAHETDEHDERTSNKISYPTLSTHMSADLSIYDMQCAIEEATGGASHRIEQLTADIKMLSTYVDTLSTTCINKSDFDKKQDFLKSGENIATINGQTLLTGGNIEIKGGESGPTTYLMEASATNNTLYITNQSGTTLSFTPTVSSDLPPGYNTLQQQVKTNTDSIKDANNNIEQLAEKINNIQNVTLEQETIEKTNVSVPIGYCTVQFDIAMSSNATIFNSISIESQPTDVFIIGHYLASSGINTVANIVLYNSGTNVKTLTSIQVNLIHLIQ